MIIEFSEFNYKLLLPLIFPIFNRLQDLTKEAYMNEDGDNHIFVTFRYFFSYLFAGIFFIILKYNTREKSVRNESNYSINIEPVSQSLGNEIDLTAQIQEKKIKIKKILFIIILCALGVSTFYCRYFFYRDEFYYAEQSTRSFCEIVTFTALSFIIIKQKLYLHHFVSLGCIIFMLFIIFFISIPYMEGINILFSLLYYFLISLAFGLYDVLIKKYLNDFYSNPYFMMLIIGVINFTLLLIFDIFAYFFNPDISGIILGLNKNINSIGDLFLFILDIILEFIWNLGILLVIYYYTPCHYFISEYISDYIYFIRKSSSQRDDDFFSISNIVIFSLCYVINFFCILVFNEVIILNFCNLGYNTRKKIQGRESIDFESLKLKNSSEFRENSSDFNAEDEYNRSNSGEKINAS